MQIQQARLEAADGLRLRGLIHIGQIPFIICLVTCLAECLGQVEVHNRLGKDGAQDDVGQGEGRDPGVEVLQGEGQT